MLALVGPFWLASKEDSVSSNGNNFVNIEALESAVIDSFIKMNNVELKENGPITILNEKSDGNYFVKLSALIMSHMATFGVEMDASNNEKYAELSKRSIFVLMEKLGITRSFMIPESKTAISDTLYAEAFEGTWVHDRYLAV